MLDKDKGFGKDWFEHGTYLSEYKASDIREYLNKYILQELVSDGANPIPTNLPDVGCTDKVYLLSVEEAKKLPRDIRKFKSDWWLRSQGAGECYAACVSAKGNIDNFGGAVGYDRYAVRPAIKVSIDELR